MLFAEILLGAAHAPLPGGGKHVVLIAAEPEYRSEEALPQLAQILERAGFQCTTLFSRDKNGAISPNETRHVPGLEALDRADLCVLMARFQAWPDEDMKHFDRYVKRNRPFLALRTSTHAFSFGDDPSEYASYSWDSKTWPGGFGRQILGETWLSHWGRHGQEGTRARPLGNHPILTGMGEIFVTTDLYEAHPPEQATVVLEGNIVSGLLATDPLRNDPQRPPQPAAWIMPGKRRVITTTLGSSLDLLDANFRRFLVQSALWAVKRDIPQGGQLDVSLVEPYKPSAWGFRP